MARPVPSLPRKRITEVEKERTTHRGATPTLVVTSRVEPTLRVETEPDQNVDVDSGEVEPPDPGEEDELALYCSVS